MGITKNRQTEEQIRYMVKAAFPKRKMEEAVELTEGLCNAAYLIRFSDEKNVILKIAAAEGKGLLSNEINMMEAEVKAMRLAASIPGIKVAKVQTFDTSKTLCSGNYFFMEQIEGQNYFVIKDTLTEEENQQISFEIGQMEQRITSVKGTRFGMLGDTKHQFVKMYDYIKYLITNVLNDAERKQVPIGPMKEEILERLEQDQEIFEEVTQPVLVHWDMWEGNIFIKNKHLSGIIDWERAMWSEAFMDDRFRRHTRNADFLRGYGKETFTIAEWKRIYWYDVFLYLTMMTEGAYREYEDDSQYQWVKPLFEESFKALQRE